MIINKRYEYPTLTRATADDGMRFYLDPLSNQPLPSVTTILSHTKDKKFLKEWQDRVGLEKANAIRDEATGLGTLLHTHMECHIQGVERPRGNNLVRQMAHRMADKIINEGLSKVDEVWGIETPLYFPQLYAGTTDLVGVYNGKPAIMDYKNTKNTKKMENKEMNEDYFCQCCAYALSHNFLFDTDIQQIVIFMVSRDLQYKAFVIEGDEFEHYSTIWQKRLMQYEETDGPCAFKPGALIETTAVVPGAV